MEVCDYKKCHKLQLSTKTALFAQKRFFIYIFKGQDQKMLGPHFSDSSYFSDTYGMLGNLSF
jgi:hypothetical protein